MNIHCRKHMFEKQLTLSDVGKLNRLIVPKQHALNYFPHIHDNEGKKDAFLNFEDELGKSWRFRYSFWNSNQSYVLTKGWSRYVREKGLEAGDVVVFERHHLAFELFFVSWRRRNTGVQGGVAQPSAVAVGGTSHTQYFLPSDWLPAGTVSGANQVAPARTSKRLRLFGVNLSDSSEP